MDKIKCFLNNYGKDVYYSIDDTSLSIAVGCELNFVEVEKIKNIISKYYKSFIVINTCFVHKKNLTISQDIIDKILQEFPTNFIFIVGCASSEFTYLELQKSNVFVIDNSHKFLDSFYESLPYAKLQDYEKPENMIGRINIQSGCDFQCSYCIIPKLRGNSVSVSYKDIKNQIRSNLNAGIKDIVLVGVNISLYVDPDEKFNLLGLAHKILEDFKEESFTLSFDSLDPASMLLPDLITLIKENEKLKKELYLATQSGSDKILKLMHRCHTNQRILNLINLGKGLKIRHDFIVGFPGETEEDFNKTLQLLRLTQDENNYGVISEFTSHFDTEASDMPQISRSLIKFRKESLEKIKNRIISMIKCDSDLFKVSIKLSELNMKKVKCLLNKLQNDEIKEIKIIKDSSNSLELEKIINILNQVKVNYQNIVVINDK